MTPAAAPASASATSTSLRRPLRRAAVASTSVAPPPSVVGAIVGGRGTLGWGGVSPAAATDAGVAVGAKAWGPERCVGVATGGDEAAQPAGDRAPGRSLPAF